MRRSPRPGRRLFMHEGADSSDRELVSRVRSGDAGAFEVLFRRFYAPLCGFAARYTGSLAIAEELVQDVMTSVWERRGQLQINTSFQSYLFTAARNKALSNARREQVQRRWMEDAANRPPQGERVDTSATPESELYAGELAAVVQGVIAAMPERRRMVYQLSRDRHMTYNEIAEVMEIAPKTVEIQIGRALKDIREGLTEAGWLNP